ncbi:SAM-dependent methyltransferase [Chthonobacter rhizosphaerae]|uniref:SAM-dependent methyltransferase n=1 Tax=Chthonobacter rhizosphaerae TaxID=2735553 RepID=UPI0015EEE199|nr:cyclopropane-fatty-acyl-phospholipid synthase family protein [Chthonobacter rhizosphaerae]
MTSQSSYHPVELTEANEDSVLRGLPALVRRSLHMVRALRYGSLDVTLPDGRTIRIPGREPGPHGQIVIHDYRAIRRVLSSADMGVAEGYMAGEWSSPDVTSFLEVFCHNHHVVEEKLSHSPAVRLFLKVRHWLNENTPRRAKKNISAHYDLGNSFYAQWLDTTMTYSSGLFPSGDEDLPAAQNEKYRHLARTTGVETGHHVLEIGCGWGGFAEFAAKEIGCQVTALTISREQYDFARRRIFEAGLADKVAIRFQDYRDEAGLYDRIASIEMFEAVGEKYWPTYFRTLHQRLKPGGAAGLQVITIQDRLFDQYRATPDFIQRYVFPGGMLPCPAALDRVSTAEGMTKVAELVFGRDYARTLALWRDRFWASWPALEPLGFDTRFKRLWEYYLHYCEAGFRSGMIDVRQIVYARGA